MTSTSPHTIETTTGIDGFGEPHDWNELVLHAPGASFFQTAQWCRAWHEHLGAGSDLAVAQVRADGRLVGGAALAVVQLPILHRPPIRVPVVTNAGAGIGGADHLGFPVAADAPTGTVDSLWKWCLEWRPEHPLLLSNLAPDTRLSELAEGALSAVDEEHCPTARIAANSTFDAVRATWTRNRRRSLTKKLHSFEQDGGKFTWLDEPSDVVEALPLVFALHDQRRTNLGRTTRFAADDRSRAFHAALASYSDNSSGCWIQLAQVRDQTVGALYGFRLGDTYSVFQSGWEPAWSDSSIGLIQYAEALRSCVERGGTTFDMCRGTDPYKLRFSTETVIERSYARARGVTGRVLSARWAARRWRRRRAADRSEDRQVS